MPGIIGNKGQTMFYTPVGYQQVIIFNTEIFTHKAQVINYLAETDFRLALLVNFGTVSKATIVREVRG
jgi:hypothetical protein